MRVFNSFWKIRKKVVYHVTASFFALTMAAHAAPNGGTVTAGQAVINQSGNTTNINQSTQNAAINWQNFSVGQAETVNFFQPNINAITLNRVVGTEQSVINGALNANGQVFILNSNGVLFGQNAQINTAGLVATTMSLSDEDFMSGKYSFKDATDASVINLGTINITDGGYAALLAKDVENEGTIRALKGTVQMTGADSATINLNGNSLVSLTVDKGILDALVSNKGAVIAEGGQIYLTANAADQLLKSVVNNEGVLEAESLDDFKGSIIVYAHGGKANITGTVNAAGGFLETSGDELNIASGAVIKASDWLIDPYDINIASSGSDNIGDIESSSISGLAIENFFNPMEGGGTSLTLQATHDINIADSAYVSDPGWSLTLDAGHDINVNSGEIFTGDNVLNILYGNALNINGGSLRTNALTVNINNVAYDVISQASQLSIINSDLSGTYFIGNSILITDASQLMLGGDTGFSGTLNGFGNYIYLQNVSINNSSDGAGLFKKINAGANVSNITFAYNLTANYGYVGALAGYIMGTSDNHVTLKNIGLYQMNLTADDENVGGIAGYAQFADISGVGIYQSSVTSDESNVGGVFGTSYISTISDVTISDLDLEGSDSVGGVIGFGSGNTISDVDIDTMHIDADDNVGGVAGELSYIAGSNLIRNTSLLDVILDTSFGENVGGVAGYAESASIETTDVQNLQIIDADKNAGGVAGYATYTSISDATVTDADIDADTYAGGVAGYLQNSGISTSSVSSSDIVSEDIGAGGIAGGLSNFSYIKNSSVDSTNITGDYAVGGLYGYADPNSVFDITDSYYQQSTTYLAIGDGDVLSNTNYITTGYLDQTFWTYYQSNGYIDAGAVGWTANGDGEYEVTDIDHFKWMSYLGQKGYTFRLMNNFDLMSEPGLYIPLLKGTLHGNGYSVSFMDLTNMKNNGGLGLAGVLMGGTIDDLTIQAASVDGIYATGIAAGVVMGAYDIYRVMTKGSELTDITITEPVPGYSFAITADSDFPYREGFGTLAGVVLDGTSIDSVTSTVDMVFSGQLNDNNMVISGVGGLVGMVENIFSGSTISDSTYSGDISFQLESNSYGVTLSDVGGLAGSVGKDFDDDKNTISGSYAAGNIIIETDGQLNVRNIGGQFGSVASTDLSSVPADADVDISITAADDRADAASIGGLAGYMDSVTLSDVNFKSDITIEFSLDQRSYISSVGIVAGNSDSVTFDGEELSFTGSLDITSDSIYYVGAISGSMDSGIINDIDVNDTNVTGFNLTGNEVGYVGGLAGDADYSGISDSSSSIDIDLSSASSASYIGGLAGDISGSFSSEYALYTTYYEDGDHMADAYSLANTKYGLDQYIADGWIVEFYPDYYSNTDSTQINVIVRKPKTPMGISNSSATGNITIGGSAEYVGGIAGYASDTGLNSVSADMDITINGNTEYAGGLLGYGYHSNIASSRFDGSIEISGNADYVGGLAGYLSGYAGDSYESLRSYVEGTEQDVLDYVSRNDAIFAAAGYQPSDEAYYSLDSTGLYWVEKYYTMENQTGAVTDSFVGTESEPVSISLGSGTSDSVTNVGGFIGYADEVTVTDSGSSTEIIAEVGDYGSVRLLGGAVGFFQDSVFDGFQTDGSITAIAGANESFMSDIGGFAGKASNSEISDVTSDVSVDVDAPVALSIGGFAGEIADSTVDSSVSTGNLDITAAVTSGVIGGFAGGISDSDVSDSYSGGNVKVTSVSGNFIGGFTGRFSDGELSYSYATGRLLLDTDSVLNIGGLAGYAENASFDHAYYAKNITIDSDTVTFLGGLIGGAVGIDVSNSYYEGNILATGQTITYVGGLGGSLTDVEIALSHSIGEVQVDFDTMAANIGGLAGSISNYGYSTVNLSDSYAVSNVTLNGSDTSQAYFVGGLIGQSGRVNADHVYFQGDINVTSGTVNYVGGFTNVTYGFKAMYSYAEGNINVTSNSISGVGGYAGYAQTADIRQSYADMDIAFNSISEEPVTISYTGGLIGQIAGTGSVVSNTYAWGNVAGVNYAGGLIGSATDTTVENSYSAGLVSAAGENVGGLIGENINTTVTESFYDETVNDSFADTEEYGRSTEELQTIGLFENAGWDVESDDDVDGYAKLTFDGTRAIWGVKETASSGGGDTGGGDTGGGDTGGGDTGGGDTGGGDTGGGDTGGGDTGGGDTGGGDTGGGDTGGGDTGGGDTGGGDTGGGDTGGGDTGGGDTGGGDTGGGDTGGGDTGGGDTGGNTNSGSTPVQAAVTSVVTSIVNQTQVSTGVNVANIIRNITQPVVLSAAAVPAATTVTIAQSAGFAGGLGFEQGSVVSVVSSPEEGQDSVPVSLGELIQLGGATAGDETSGSGSTAGGAPQNYTVRLGQDSIVDLINGGINLPEGVQQEYYLVGTPANRERQQ